MNKKAHIYYTMFISFISVALNCFINLYLAPKITNNVGVEAYGFVSLTKNFVTYANIIMTALNSYAARYMTVAYVQDKKDDYQKYYSTVFLADLFLGGIIFIIGLVCIFKLEVILNIPQNLIGSVKLLFLLTFMTFYITTISTVFFATGYVKDKLDVINSIKGWSYIVEIAILIFSFFILQPKVWYVGVGTLAAALVLFIGSYIFTKKAIPESKIKISKFSNNALKKLVMGGVWNSVNSMGNALNSGLDLLISDLLLSAVSMGQVSIAKTINNMLYTIYSTIAQPFQPTFLREYSENNKKVLIKELKYSMKVCGVLTNIVFAGFCTLGVAFYQLWIPTQDIHLVYRLTVLAMLPCITEGCMYPLYYVYTLTVKNKIPCFITIIGGVLNVVSMYILLKYTRIGVYAIVITTAVIMNFINMVTNPIYICKCLKVKITTFYPNILKNILCCVFAVIAMKVSLYFSPQINTWIMLVIKGVLCVIVGFLAQIFILFKPEEIHRMGSKVICKLRKKE